MTQAKGSKGRLVIDFETTFGSDPSSKNGRALPFNSNSMAGTQAKNSAATITGNRNPVKPFAGNIDAGGSLVIPVDTTAFYYWLYAMFGAPTLTMTNPQALNAAAVQDETGGLVGIQCTGHGYTTGDTIRISGTTNYDGEYTVNAATTTDEIVVAATYVSETLATSDLVGEPPYTYEFKVGDSMPSMVIEKGFTDLGLYWKYNGCRVSRFSLSVGGDGELTANIEIMAAQEGTPGNTAYDSTPVTVSINRLGNFQAAIKEGGNSTSECTSFDISINFGLDGDQRVIGGNGMRGALPEGIISVEVSYTALYQDNAIVTKGAAGTETSLQLTITNGTNVLDFLFQEGEFERVNVPISGPGGVRQSTKFIGFYDNGSEASSVVATLTNSVYPE